MFSFILIVVLAVGALVGLTIANYRFAEQNPGGNDFLARWMGGRAWLLEGTSPYDESVSLRTQELIYGHPADPAKGEDKNHFVYPLTSMIFFGPFSLLEYLPARALWMTLLEASLFLLAVVSLRLAGWNVSPVKAALLIAFAILWYHGARTIIIGQFAGLNALLITLALLLIQQKIDFMAGILLALSTAKPQMVFLLIPFVLLWSISAHRRDLLWGTLLGFLLLLAASLALMPDWPLQMVRQMVDYPNYTNIGSPISVIANATPGIRGPLNLFLHVIFALYLLLEWILAWGKDDRHFLWVALLTIVITNLIALRTATTNYVMLLPVLFVIFKIWENRWGQLGRWIVWSTLAFLGIGLWALFLITVKGNVEQAIMYLPLPFLCLVGLWWIRWWAVRPPKVLLDELRRSIT